MGGAHLEGSCSMADTHHIAVVAPHFEEYALGLANGLACERKVALFVEKSLLETEFIGRDMPVSLNLAVKDLRFSSPFGAISALIGLVKFRPSVIHVQEASGLLRALTCAWIVAMTRRCCRIALTVHDPMPHVGRDEDIAKRLRYPRKFVRRMAHVVFVHGRHCYEQYVSLHPPREQKVVITDHGTILAGDRISLGPSDGFNVLFFGRMEKYKGVDVLLEAMRLCRQRGAQIQLHIAGRGPELDRLEAEFRRIAGVTICNRFLSAVDVIEAIQKADALVLPYLSASQSGVLASAFANGRFVIASRVGGIQDVVDPTVNGVLVTPNDSKQLADALCRLAVAPEIRERLKLGARATGATRLNWDVIARNSAAAYWPNCAPA